MSDNQLTVGDKKVLQIRQLTEVLIHWAIYGEEQLNGDESPAVVQAIKQFSLGIERLEGRVDDLGLIIAGLGAALNTAIEQRDQAIYLAEMAAYAQSDECLAEDIAARGIADVSIDAQEALLERLQRAERMVQQYTLDVTGQSQPPLDGFIEAEE
jgi:hypothetical protein